jgi:hypothetical protein
MSDIVVDSSVVAKWILPEFDSPHAQKLITEVAMRGDRLIVLDLAFPEVEGRRTLATRAANRMADWVLGVCSYDIVVAEKFFRVNNFLDPPARLLHPVFIFQLATAKLRRRRRGELLPVAGQKVA